MSKYVKEVPAPNKSMTNTRLTTCVLVVARYFKELWQGLTSENLLRNFQFSWHAIKQDWKETLIMCRIYCMELRLTNSNYCTNSTFTWDPKWTQTGVRGKISLRCELTSLSASTWLQAWWNSFRCKFHLGQFDRSEISNFPCKQ